MADQKITELTENTTPLGTDLLALVDDPAGSPSTQKIKISNVLATSNDGWLNANETWAYVSTDDPTGIFKVNADVTTKYSAGMRIKMTNGGNVIYGIITVVNAYGADEAGYTYIKFLHQIDPTDNLALVLLANSAITLNYYSTQKAPQGFPLSPASWQIEISDTETRSQATPTANAYYNLGTTNCQISVPIGLWKLEYSANGFADRATAGTVDIIITLSTANNSATNNKLTGRIVGNDVIYIGGNITKNDIVAITTKTTYYLNGRTAFSSITNIYFVGAYGNTTIRAVCAYL